METSLIFNNTTLGDLTFEQVFQHIINFVKNDLKGNYRLCVGTDSHVHATETKFITAILLHRVGKGAWGCVKTHKVNRRIKNIYEKISLETLLSQEVAYLFTEERLHAIQDLMVPYVNDGADFEFEIHLDIGDKGKTKEFINEMTGRIHAMGMEPKIKPYAYAAFSYANKYTK